MKTAKTTKTAKKPANTVYEIITERLIAALEAGTAPWSRPWASAGGQGGMPRNFCSRRPYSGVNVWMLASAGFSSPYWLTFNQARKLGGCVRRGEKGSPVVYWTMIESRKKDEDGKARLFPLLRYFTVFNVEQCDGIELPDAGIEALEFEEIPECEDVVAGMPQRPEIVHGGDVACYRPKTDTVCMPAREHFLAEESYYSTLFHELAHATGHGSRLGRGLEVVAPFGSPDYSREELVAEMAASYLCGVCGIENETLGNSAAYLAGWIRALRADPRMAVQAASAAQKAADWIRGVERQDVEAGSDFSCS